MKSFIDSVFTLFSYYRDASTGTDDEEYHDAVRPITMEDLLTSYKKMKTSKIHTGTLSTAKLDLD